MSNKSILLAITGILSFLVVLPMSLVQTYLLYQYIHAPQVVWVLWIINIPLLILTTIINEMVKKMKD